jgi:ribosomal protein L7/L12
MTMKISYYKKAMEIIADGDIDYRVVCMRLAAENPKLFVKYAKKRTEKDVMDEEISSMLLSGKRGVIVDAVKLVREKLGIGLKEASDYVKALQQEIQYGAKEES